MKLSSAFLFLVCFFICEGVFASPERVVVPPDVVSGVRATPVVRAVQKVMPTVINISTEEIVRVSDPFDAFFNDFFKRHRYRYRHSVFPLGSGVLVDSSGLAVTNYHVVKRASRIIVTLWDGGTVPASLVAYDEANDLALLRLEIASVESALSAIEFALPEDLFPGETVVTVGNPFGLEHSVASGVLSACNRVFREGDVTFDDILQTDASINPGNSGGPLVNLEGELIGVSLAIRKDAQGIGFAIPLRRIEEVLAEWLIPSQFSSDFCGLIPGTELAPDGKASAVVASVIPGSPAEDSGLRSGDRILSLNGIEVSRAVEVGRILWQLSAGDELRVVLDGGETTEFEVVEIPPDALIQRRLGLRIQELSPVLSEALGLPRSLHGLAISEVLEKSCFASTKIGRGDIIIGIGDRETAELADAYAALKDKPPGSSVPVYLLSLVKVGSEIYLRRIDTAVTLR